MAGKTGCHLITAMAPLQQGTRQASALLKKFGLKEVLEAGARELRLDIAVCSELLLYLLVQRRLEHLLVRTQLRKREADALSC
jgi:hypothetical protein